MLADAHGVSFERIPRAGSAMFLPGALKYGGLGGLAALRAPTRLAIYGTSEIPAEELGPLSAVYQAAGSSLTLKPQPLTADEVALCVRSKAEG